MLRRLQNRLRFRIERLLLRGALYRLLFIAGLIGLISLVAGFLLMEIEQDFARPGVFAAHRTNLSAFRAALP